jgi:hypothetical protein
MSSVQTEDNKDVYILETVKDKDNSHTPPRSHERSVENIDNVNSSPL